MIRRRRPTGMMLVAAAAVLIMLYLILVPLGMQAVASLRGPFLPFFIPDAKWGFENYTELYGSVGSLGRTVWVTALFVGGAAAISISIAAGLAWLTVRTDIPGRNLITVLVLAPAVIPPIVLAQGFYLMLAPESGVFNQLLRLLPLVDGASGPIDPFAFPSIVVIQGLSFIPFPYLLFLPILQNMDGTLEEAARASGARWSATIRRITIPMLWPALFGVILLEVILLMGSLEVPLLFGNQSGRDIFALRMWNFVRSGTPGQLPQYGLAAVYGMHFFLTASVLFTVYWRVTKNAHLRASVSGKGFRPSRLALGRWKYPSLAAVTLLLVPTAVFPLLALVWSAIIPYQAAINWDNFTNLAELDAFSTIIQDGEFWASLWRTVIIAGLSATIAVLVATVLAYTVARGRRSWSLRVLDVISSASIAIPAVIAGFSTFILYLVMNRYVQISGTIWALVLAYSYRLSIAYRTTLAATLQIKMELEEAAWASGASRLETFRRVVLPLLLPTMSLMWIALFVLGSHEFTLAVFLATPDTGPLSTYVYSRFSANEAGTYAPAEGAAAGLVFTALVLLLGYGLQLAMSRRTIARTGAAGRRSPAGLALPPSSAPSGSGRVS